MSFRAVFTRFDHFMTMFVAVFAVAWSTVFMPLLGGPLHTYEARAIGVGWASLRTGEAASIGEAIDIAASLPADILLPPAAASEIPLQADVRSETLELLGGPDFIFARDARPQGSATVQTTRVSPGGDPRVGTCLSSCPEAIADADASERLAAST